MQNGVEPSLDAATMSETSSRLPLLAAMAAAVGASLCCLAPLLLALMGIGGAWISSLTALDPYRPVFIGMAVVAIGIGAWRVHRPIESCAPGDACASPATRRRQQILFWSLSAIVLALLASPWLIAWAVL